MSEEILKALMELFAIVVKQDGGTLSYERDYVSNFLKKQLTREAVDEYMDLFDKHAGPVSENDDEIAESAPSVKDSVKIFGICKKINRTLNQEQKIVVLMRLYELVNSNKCFTKQRMNIITTVGEVFRISPEEFSAIEEFTIKNDIQNIRNPSIVVLNCEKNNNPVSKKLHAGYQDTDLIILKIASVDLYFLKYISREQLYLNGLPIRSENVYTFPKGGAVKSLQGYPIYYSDISSCFLSETNISKISFVAENLTYRFRDGETAINNVSFSTGEGKLVGIMGASGSGKTTLLNLLSGIQKPTSGKIRINRIPIEDTKNLDGVFGFVPQDDLLIEDLTVFENLYFAACQCLNGKSREEIVHAVEQTLSNLDLLDKKDLKVGSPFNKMISGGQRKRLNIGLELISEPSIMFVDEPTSGLSSRDSDNLMALFRNLTLKGKLIFVVIHQPSSEIFKMFDKVIILDQGGYMAFSGNPVEAVVYFKTLDAQINSNIGECPSCGNVNPETIFNIIGTQVVDEFGRYTEKRKVNPNEWAETFNSKYPYTAPAEVEEKPPHNLRRPGWLEQFRIYFTRDLLGKIANRQYIALTLLEAPVLGFVLSIIIRYIPDPDSNVYIFAENENIPIYIFMSLIVALFLGLTISAEEIFRDRKILKRERFLNLSRSSYLASKVSILIIISAIQTLLFILIANRILEVKGLFINYWLALFATAFCANMLGLNISASFNSAITIYIVIPLLIIPMMVLSGAMFPFDKLNRKIGNVEKVPLIAEMMPTRWTYEALIVSQFKDNRYSKIVFDKSGDSYYEMQKKLSEASFNKVHRIPVLRDALKTTLSEFRKNIGYTEDEGDIRKKQSLHYSRLELLKNELTKITSFNDVPKIKFIDELQPGNFSLTTADSISAYLDRADKFFSQVSNTMSDQIDKFYNLNEVKLKKIENEYYNYSLKEIVTKPYERRKVLIFNNNIIQNTDPVYLDPDQGGPFDFRTHFFAPAKYIVGIKTDTFLFNVMQVLLSTVILYITLYYELLARVVRFFENLNFRK
jgi:ABC-type multidrug transport system ATPase subunit